MSGKDTVKMVVNLTKEEAAALMEMSALAGCTGPADLLEGFVADLTESKRNHGSDERSAAWQWYDRAVYGMIHYCPDARSWLQELLVINGMLETGYDSVMDVLRIEQDYKFSYNSIKWATDETDKKQLLADAGEAKAELEAEYQRYLDLTKRDPKTTSMQNELKNIRHWVKAYHRMGLDQEDK